MEKRNKERINDTDEQIQNYRRQRKNGQKRKEINNERQINEEIRGEK